MFSSKNIEHLTIVVLNGLDYPVTSSSSHGLLQQRRQQYWTTAVRTVYLNLRPRAPKRSWHVAVLSRSLLLAIAVDISRKKEGVPVRWKASQREGLGRRAKSAHLAQPLQSVEFEPFILAFESTEE